MIRHRHRSVICKRVNITVLAPSAPTRLIGIPGSRSISHTWSQSSLDVVDSYIISYTGMTGCASAPSGSLTITGLPTSYILSSLEEATDCVIAMKAKNTAGFSPASNSLVVLHLPLVSLRWIK